MKTERQPRRSKAEGRNLRLKETVAPEGYTVTTDITFTLTKEGKITVEGKEVTDNAVLVKDELTKFTVSKTDISGDEELEGAELQIVDPKSGEVVKTISGEELKWTSKKDENGKTAKTVEGLKEGTYVLKETVAPEGYTVTTDLQRMESIPDA